MRCSSGGDLRVGEVAGLVELDDLAVVGVQLIRDD
jgi:hypothetical protein